MKILIRSILKKPISASLNTLLLGLSLSITFLIYGYYSFHKGFDTYHENADKVYMVHTLFEYKNNVTKISRSSLKAVDEYVNRIPEITKKSHYHGYEKLKSQDGFELDGSGVDLNFFEFFDFEVEEGRLPEEEFALNEVILTKTSAANLFGGESAIGKEVTLERGGLALDLYVIAVITDHPQQSTFQDEFYISIEHYLSKASFAVKNNWDVSALASFIMVDEGARKAETIEAEMYNIRSQYDKEESLFNSFKNTLMLFTDYHGSLGQINQPWGRSLTPPEEMKGLNQLLVTGIIIGFLGLASLMLKLVSDSLRKRKEIGVKRILGASKNTVIIGFIQESVFYIVLASFLVLVILSQRINYNSILLGTTIDFPILSLQKLHFIAGYLVLCVFLLSLFPSLFYNSIKPLDTLLNKLQSSAGIGFGKVMAFLQLVIILISLSFGFTIQKQAAFLTNFDTGLNLENVYQAKLSNYLNDIPAYLESDLQSFPGVKNVAKAAFGSSIKVVDLNGESETSFTTHYIDESFFDIYGVNLLAGEGYKSSNNFSVTNGDTTFHVVIGQSVIQELGFDDPLGERIRLKRENRTLKVIGVVPDLFLNGAMYMKSPDLYIAHDYPTAAYSDILVKMEATPSDGLLEDFKKYTANSSLIKNITPARASDYSDIDQSADLIFVIFSLVLAMAGIGIMGTLNLAFQNKIKSITIRKLLGSKDINSVLSYLKGILLTTLCSLLMALPMSYLLINEYLTNFNNRFTDVHVPLLLSVLIITALLVIACVTQLFKVRVFSPLETVRNE